MKMKKEHFDRMRDAIVPHDTQFHRMRYIEAGLSDKRYRWDLMRHAGLVPFICRELYSYLDDKHVDTALAKIVPSLYDWLFWEAGL